MRRPLVVLDTECATTSGPPHLLEVAAVRVRGGEALEHFSTLVRPEVPIEPEASAVHGILDEEVRDAPPAPAAIEELCRFAGDDWLVAHNARSDAHVLAFECARHRLSGPPGPLLDTLPLARHALPEAADHKLATLVELLELEDGVAHRALPDAVACAQVLDACVRRLGGWERVDDGQLLRLGGAALTLRSAAPGAPRGGRVVRALEEARQRGGAVRLVYGELGTALSTLEVAPRLVFRSGSRGYLEGECLRSGTLKTYRLDRVRRVDAFE
jgi:DNA polymerase III epsilon subunit-like protein